MKCYICNATLQPDEIKQHPQIKKFEPCGHCLSIIAEVFEPLDDEEIARQLEAEEVETVEGNPDEETS